MRTIAREELKQKLERGDSFKLIMVLDEWHFRALRIPGSLHINELDKARHFLGHHDDIVLYCSGATCNASRLAYELLSGLGYRKVRRYVGGLADWQAAGYPLEGEMAQ